MCRLQSVHKENFAKYGRALEFSADCRESFEIVITEEREPWRLAVFRYRNKSVKRL